MNRVKNQVKPKTDSPILLDIFAIMADRNMGTAKMADKLEANIHTVSRWRSGYNYPTILWVEKMAIELGYRLVLEPAEKGKNQNYNENKADASCGSVSPIG